MLTFSSLLAPAFIATVLLASGMTHALSLRRFAAVVRAHGVLPPRGAGVVAVAVVFVELLLGVGAVALMTGRAPRGGMLAVMSGCLVLALAFLAYLRQLLRRPRAAATCGCSPLESPLSELSRVPAAALAVVSSVGLLATLVQSADAASMDAALLERALSLMWGVALAGTVLLVPAAVDVPEPNPASAAGR